MKFSIIMPCFNSEAYVENAIHSILSQTHYDWELIAINDGSSDMTLEILDKYALCDSRINVYSKTNGGYATAINLGFEKMSGDYFMMMGSDDYLAPKLLEMINEKADLNNPDIIGFRAIKIIDKAEQVLDDKTQFFTEASMFNCSIAEFEKQYPEHSKILFVRDTAKCFKREIRGNLKLFGKTGLGADGIFSTLYAQKCQSFMCLPIDGYFWTIRSDSVSAKLSKSKKMDCLDSWMKYAEELLLMNDKCMAQQTKAYLSAPIYLGYSILSDEKEMTLKEVNYVTKCRMRIINICKQINYSGALPRNPVKRLILLKTPFLCSYMIRICNMIKR